MIKYCPTCNRPSDKFKFIGEFCEVCITDKLKEGIPDSVVIERCKSCERIRTPTGYTQSDKNSLKEAMQQALKSKCSISIVDFDWKIALLKFTCEVDGNQATFEKKIHIKVKKTMCMDCYRRTSGYYEAVIQLRGPREPVDRMLKKFTNFIDVRGAFVSRLDELPNGYDIYMSDKKMAGNFFQYYDLKPKRSYTLYGMKRGNKLYRNIYLLRLS